MIKCGFYVETWSPKTEKIERFYLYKCVASVQTKIGEVKFAKTHVVLIGLGWGCLATQVQAHKLPLDPFLPLPSPVKALQGFYQPKTTNQNKKQFNF